MSRETEKATPHASVVVPAYWSQETIGDCLDALAAQTFVDFELVVVNSSQESETRRIVESRYPTATFEQSPTRLLPHAARNRGVELARGRLLVFTDPDCAADPDWLTRLVEASDAGHAVVCGAMAVREPTPFATAIHLAKFAAWLPGLPAGPRAIAPTANVCYTRGLWEEIGPFAGEVFSGDTLQSWRAARAGATPWFEPRAIVSHRHDDRLGPFLRERRRRGSEFARVRAADARWSRAHAAAYAVAAPLLPAITVARRTANALRAGQGRELVPCLPFLVAADAAWAAGEARGYATHARSRTDR